MKTIPLLFLTLLNSTVFFGQTNWEIDFDNPLYVDRITIDTISNPNCLWQIGQPNKTKFSQAHSALNSIVTDLLSPVSANDTSTFYVAHQWSAGNSFHVFTLSFWYQMDGDSTDFGIIEISPDSGVSWINILDQDTTFQMQWLSPKPTLSGSTVG